MLAHLCGVELPSEPNEPYILVMAEVVPSDVAGLDRQRVAGILTARGGATAHSATPSHNHISASCPSNSASAARHAQTTPVMVNT